MITLIKDFYGRYWWRLWFTMIAIYTGGVYAGGLVGQTMFWTATLLLAVPLLAANKPKKEGRDDNKER